MLSLLRRMRELNTFGASTDVKPALSTFGGHRTRSACVIQSFHVTGVSLSASMRGLCYQVFEFLDRGLAGDRPPRTAYPRYAVMVRNG